MASRKKAVELVNQIVVPFAQSHGLDVYDVEYVKEGSQYVLRVILDKETPVSTDDCALVSEFLSAELDKDDPFEEAYNLEVSSPGIERALKKDSDFKRFSGKKVRVSLFKPFEGRKVYEGQLVGLEDGVIILDNAKLNRDLVSQVRLVFEFE